MRAVIQRVTRAQVQVDDGEQRRVVGSIGAGLAVLVGITHDDGPEHVAKLAKKIAQLKILRDGNNSDDPRNRVSALERDAEILLVSQFTLYANVRKGSKPSWSHAAPGEVAEPIFSQLVAAVRDYGLTVATGCFGAEMQVELVNDGPLTIVVDI